MTERPTDIVPERIEVILLKKSDLTESEKEELREWREGVESDDVYDDYLSLMRQREIAATGKKK